MRPYEDLRVVIQEKREIETHTHTQTKKERELYECKVFLSCLDRALNTTTCEEASSNRETHCVHTVAYGCVCAWQSMSM